jgi:hypothetical protein
MPYAYSMLGPNQVDLSTLVDQTTVASPDCAYGAGYVVLSLSICQYFQPERSSVASITRPRSRSLTSPSADPYKASPYQALSASETDSWLRPDALGNRPLAHEWPTYQSLKRCGG